MSVNRPSIRPLQWTDARSVLPNEARDFTPWLADNIELLAEALGLDSIAVEATEYSVEEFRLDILATGTDASGEEIAIVIENQYGRSNHDHLGKLITYAAKAEVEADRVLSVWLVERAAEGHRAAIEFLNRVTGDELGWVLLSAKFVESADGYYVHFVTHAEPNAFLKSKSTGRSTGKAVLEKAAYMAAVAKEAAARLEAAGYGSHWCDPKGGLIRFYLPKSSETSRWVELRALCQETRFRAVAFVSGPNASPEQNADVLEALRVAAPSIESLLSTPAALEWHAQAERHASAFARYTLEGTGYRSGEVGTAADWLVEFGTALLQAADDFDEETFPVPDDQAGSADAASVVRVAALVQPGEWTTYGDISTVLIGRSGAALSIGNMARSMPDFPHPHRLLAATGKVPPQWTTLDGTGGPEVCRERLEAEGVGFQGDRADPAQRVPVDVLAERYGEAEA